MKALVYLIPDCEECGSELILDYDLDELEINKLKNIDNEKDLYAEAKKFIDEKQYYLEYCYLEDDFLIYVR